MVPERFEGEARVVGVCDGVRCVDDGRAQVWVEDEGVSFVPKDATGLWVPFERFHPVETRYTGMLFRIDGRSASVSFLRRSRIAVGVVLALAGPLLVASLVGLVLGMAAAVGMVDGDLVGTGLIRMGDSSVEAFAGLVIRACGTVLVAWEVLRAGGLAAELDEQIEAGRRWIDRPLVGRAA